MVQFDSPRFHTLADKDRLPGRTLEDIVGVISRSPDLRETHRRSILSALRVAARCIGRLPSEISAQPAALQKELAAVNYLQSGLSKKRWTTVRSLTLTALRRSGANIMPSRWQHSVFTGAWSELRTGCQSHRHLVGLSRFMNYCAARNIEPNAVDTEIFAEFQQSLKESLVRKPDLVYGRTCRLWDSAHRVSDAWPVFRTNFTPASKGYSLDWSTFPESLQKDVEDFLSYGGNRDILSDNYAPSVSDATTRGRRKSLRQMATALVASGKPLNEITDLGILVDPQNAKEILRFFLNRAGGKPTEGIYNSACLIRTIARNWVGNVPDYAKLDQLCRNISSNLHKNRGMKQRNRERLHQFDNPKNEQALLQLPEKLLRLARKQDSGTSASANYALYGLAIEILLVAPIRIKNLVHLEIGRHIILPSNRGGRVILSIPSDEVKNRMDLEFRLPKSSSAMLQVYLKEFRPKITSKTSNWLFPNPCGEHRNVVGFGAQISHVIARHTGIEMHPHLFRHFAVKLIEAQNPGSADLERRLLGHHSIATTIRAYSENRAATAHQHYEDLLERKRGKLTGLQTRREGANR